MVAVRLLGGLGNQLFQYSFGRALTQKMGDDLYFYMLDKNVGPESLSILNFNVNINLLNRIDIKKIYHFFGNNLLVRAERKLTSKFTFIHRGICIESATGYTEINASFPTSYDGYLQSYRYFGEIADQLKQELTLKDSFKIPSVLKEEISNCQSVAVHVRRSDYLSRSNRSIYGYCNEDYYRRAISYISDKVPDPHFYIFSDEIEWVRQNFNFLPERTRFIVHSAVPPDCIDISLMRYCNHNIIANSTFSWWGAFLGDHRDKIVIAPKNWYINKPDFKIRDLIPVEWILM
jgi:hypothetical protein